MLQRSHIFRLLIIMPLLVVFVTLLSIGNQTASLANILSQEYEHHAYVNKYNNLIWNIGQYFVHNTRFENKININRPPQQDTVNIYVVDKNSKRFFPKINCNCASLGQNNTIICDAELLEYFRHLIDISEDGFDLPSKEQASRIRFYMNTRFSFFLLQWMMGHEIGHLVLNHGTGKSYFQAPSTLLGIQQQTSSGKIRREYEQTADQFVIEHLRLSSVSDQFWAWLSLSNVISKMYAQALHEQGDRQLKTLELIDSGEPHPPWLIRALDMATLLINTSVFPLDNTGYFDTLRQTIHIRSAKNSQPSTLCKAKVTPSNNDVAIATTKENASGDDYSLHLRFGFEYSQVTEYDAAIAEFTQAINLMIALKATPQDLLEAYLSRGSLYFRKGKYEQAIADWEAATKLQPNDERAYVNRGFVYYEQGEIEQAINQWEIAVKLNPISDEGWAGLGIGFYSTGNTKAALIAYQKALAIKANYSSLEWLRYERLWTDKSLSQAAVLLPQIQPLVKF